MSFIKSIEGDVKWVGNQIVGAIDTFGAGVEWQAERLGVGALTKKQAAFYNDRFWEQWKKSIAFIFSSSSQSPIYKIIDFIFHEAVKKNGFEFASKAIRKSFPSVSIHLATKATLNTFLVKPVVQEIMTGLIASQGLKKFITIFGTIGVGTYITEQGTASIATLSSINLKIQDPKIYHYLYTKNLDMFWFLIADRVKNIMRHL
jgi:hypothetical protein|tara:strand:- start:1478 stop:2086 length:609 start_codon:yes stop_codon:yes gene_type:complete